MYANLFTSFSQEYLSGVITRDGYVSVMFSCDNDTQELLHQENAATGVWFSVEVFQVDSVSCGVFSEVINSVTGRRISLFSGILGPGQMQVGNRLLLGGLPASDLGR